MKSIYQCSAKIVAAFALLLSINSFANQADLDAEKSAFMKLYASGGLAEKKLAVKELEERGYSDPAIFDPIEKDLLDNQNVTLLNDDDLDAVSWLIKGLSFSGNEKYLPTITKAATQNENIDSPAGREKIKKFKRHANTALQDLPSFTRWNTITSKDLDKAPTGKLNQQRVLNLLRSDDVEAVRKGVTRVYWTYSKGRDFDKELVDEVQKVLLATYQLHEDDKIYQDALAWMCKVLANTGDSTYAPAVKKVAENASGIKLRKYAQKYANSF